MTLGTPASTSAIPRGPQKPAFLWALRCHPEVNEAAVDSEEHRTNGTGCGGEFQSFKSQRLPSSAVLATSSQYVWCGPEPDTSPSGGVTTQSLWSAPDLC